MTLRAHFVAVLVLAFVVVTPSHADERSPHLHRPELPQAQPPALPLRIVSLAPVVTETLFLLGAGPRVVGVTRFCDRPAEAQTRTVVGGYVDVQLERMLSLKPDLVIAMPSQGQRAVLDRLRELGVPVFVAFGDTLDELRALLPAVADVVGAHDRGVQLLASLDARLAHLRAHPSALHPRVAVVVGSDPWVLAGPHTFIDDAIALLGARPVVPRTAPSWPVWSLEALAHNDIDVLVVTGGPQEAAHVRAIVQSTFGAHPPRVVSSTVAFLQRPGPTFADDVETLARLLVDSP